MGILEVAAFNLRPKQGEGVSQEMGLSIPCGKNLQGYQLGKLGGQREAPRSWTVVNERPGERSR